MVDLDKNLHTSIYEHFYTFSKRKSVCVITNKQIIFLSYRNTLLDSHLNGLKLIDKMAFGVENDDFLLNIGNYINIVTTDKSMQIVLPHRQFITQKEYDFLLYYLEEVNKLSDVINIEITISGRNIKPLTTKSIDDVIKHVETVSIGDRDNNISPEEIIGTTYEELFNNKKRYIKY
jgi:hypothetical protein